MAAAILCSANRLVCSVVLMRESDCEPGGFDASQLCPCAPRTVANTGCMFMLPVKEEPRPCSRLSTVNRFLGAGRQREKGSRGEVERTKARGEVRGRRARARLDTQFFVVGAGGGSIIVRRARSS